MKATGIKVTPEDFRQRRASASGCKDGHPFGPVGRDRYGVDTDDQTPGRTQAMTELTPAQKALSEALRVKNEILLEEDARENGLRRDKIIPLENQVRAAEAEVKAIIEAEFAQRLKDAEQVEQEAMAIADAERVASITPKYGPDVVLCEWECGKWSSHYRLTGNRGRMEVWSNTSRSPSNISYRPVLGTVVVRRIKANGTISDRFVEGYKIQSWLPEGEKPEGAK